MAIIKLGFLTLRAQPLHEGHKSIISQALQQCDKLILLVGSVNRVRSYLNPWSYQERREIIVKEFDEEVAVGKVQIYPLNDYRYSDAQWLSDFNQIIELEKAALLAGVLNKVIIFGHKKPGNDYLDLFKNTAKYIDLSSDWDGCASDIRHYMYTAGGLPSEAVSDRTYYINEAKRFAGYPYPTTLSFNCSDAIVECNGHIALIQRKLAPGKGAWAMPGGFREQRETFIDGAIRELIEEVNIRVPEKVLRGSIVSTRLFDDPWRSQGIPRNTMAVHFKVSLDQNGKMPELRPADDAIRAVWVPINVVMNEITMYDDHQDIISTMLNVQPMPAHINPRYL